jgi:hypothetical protein
MSGMTTCSREPSGVDEGGRHVDPSTRGAQHPLDEVGQFAGREDRRRQLAAAALGDEHPAGLVDPDLLDLRVVQVPLQRPEAGHPVQYVADDGLRVADRRQRRGQRPLRVLGDDIAHEHAHRSRVGQRVETAPADQLTDLAVHDVESCRHETPAGRKAGRTLGSSGTVRELKRPRGGDQPTCGYAAQRTTRSGDRPNR